MKSHTTRRFREAFASLPEPVKQQARKAYRLFSENPTHPSLRFKPVGPAESIYSVRISRGYRALAVREGGELIWFWIGSHADYEQLLEQL